MENKQIKELMVAMERSGLTKLHLKKGSFELDLERVNGNSVYQNLEEEPKGNASASFEKTAEAEHHEIGEDKRGGRGHGALRIDERLDHRRLILTVNSLRNKQAGSHLYWSPRREDEPVLYR